jgi:AcrR family transcriptional regulator
MLTEETPRPDALTAFKLARRAFMAGDRIEMRELASRLDVSRATIFRWVGSRDELLAQVIWSVSAPTLDRVVEAEDRLRGGARIAAVMAGFAAATIASEPFMGFVQREPERALRLLTTKATFFQSRMIERVEALLQEEVDAGHLDLPLPVHDMAYLTVRITETFVYADVIAGETPDPEKVRNAMGALFPT